ncbi:sugar transferase, partial [Nostoc sp. FACHB-888]|uniref:sugar transferase n=1 Tax=Nostoc sp. FACHB-888 TaxID=2692842 RepID=UPI001681E676
MSNTSTSNRFHMSVIDDPHNAAKAKLPVHPCVLSKAKRMIDILGAVVGLSITLIVVIPIAIAIELDSPGPIFYSQVRCGLNGRYFRIWKFRSMSVGADQLKHLVKNEAQSDQIFK